MMRLSDERNLLKSELLRRGHVAMTGKDHVVLVDQHRIGEAELADTVGDLPDLLLRVGARVAGIIRSHFSIRFRGLA